MGLKRFLDNLASIGYKNVEKMVVERRRNSASIDIKVD